MDAAEDFTDAEREAINKFRSALSDVKEVEDRDDYELVRWLRARNLDINQSAKMYREAIVFRKEWGIDTLLDTWKPPKLFLEYYPTTILGYAKNGAPVVLTRMGALDFKGFVKSVPSDDILRFVFYVTEDIKRRMLDQSARIGRRVTQHIAIYDMEGITFSQICNKQVYELLSRCLTMTEHYFPEILQTVYMINAPRIFTVIYNLLKGLVSEETLLKVRVFGATPSEWTRTLLAVIDADVLPVVYGGTRTDPDGDGTCKSQVTQGGLVPVTFYMNKKTKPKHDLKKVSINKGEKLKLDYKVKTSGDRLKWEFLTERADIGFGILYNVSEHTAEDVLPVERVASHVETEEGQWICERPGKYTVLFDNSYSVSRKELSYHIKISTNKI